VTDLRRMLKCMMCTSTPSFFYEELLALSTSTCFGHPFYLSINSSMEMGHFAFNKMAQHHATTETSGATSMKAYQVNGWGEEYPIRSPDLSPPLDFYFRGSLKDLAYRRKPQTPETVTGRNCHVVCRNPSGHLGHCCSCTSPPHS
jgi:hypothetical protein